MKLLRLRVERIGMPFTIATGVVLILLLGTDRGRVNNLARRLRQAMCFNLVIIHGMPTVTNTATFKPISMIARFSKYDAACVQFDCDSDSKSNRNTWQEFNKDASSDGHGMLYDEFAAAMICNSDTPSFTSLMGRIRRYLFLTTNSTTIAITNAI